MEGRNRPGALEVERAREAGWIEVQAPQKRDLVKILQRDLDDGEAEAIALAVERKAAVAFLDEADARRVARHIRTAEDRRGRRADSYKTGGKNLLFEKMG